MTKNPVNKPRSRNRSIEQKSVVDYVEKPTVHGEVTSSRQRDDTSVHRDGVLSVSSSSHDLMAYEQSPVSIARSHSSNSLLSCVNGQLSSVPPKKRHLVAMADSSEGSSPKAVETNKSTQSTQSTLPQSPLRVLPQPIANRISDTVVREVAHELPNDVYEQIWRNGVDLATTMCAAWHRDELGDTLYNDPLVSDPRFQMRFMEARLSRAVRCLKRARCFAKFNDLERLALLKGSLLTTITTVTGFSAVINAEIEVHTMTDKLEDGRVLTRGFALYVASFDRIGIDLRPVITDMFNFNHAMKLAFPNDWPMLYSLITILTVFRSLPDDVVEETDGLQRLTGESLETRCTAVRREHIAFLRRYTRNLRDQPGDRVRLDLVTAEAGSGPEACWHFCMARLRDIETIGAQLQTLALRYCANEPSMSAQIIPLMHELINRLVHC